MAVYFNSNWSWSVFAVVEDISKHLVVAACSDISGSELGSWDCQIFCLGQVSGRFYNHCVVVMLSTENKQKKRLSDKAALKVSN